jgi:hypothetical protein
MNVCHGDRTLLEAKGLRGDFHAIRWSSYNTIGSPLPN